MTSRKSSGSMRPDSAVEPTKSENITVTWRRSARSRMNESIHGERTTSEPQDRVTELIEQQTAISEVLRAIARSPHGLQPIFDAILDSATRLCLADAGSLRLSDESG